ncbi:MAG TPA: GNAT family N-acetyltransferase [Pilimelia sp.]|nr:GNAT family N-acetyltransferase [Pilimelia sp.]
MAIRFVLDPPLTAQLRERIVTLWHHVTNAGGAVGFVAPVTRDDIMPTAVAALADVTDGHDRLLAGFDNGDGDGDGELVAMLFLTSRRFALQDHWRTIKRVMVHPARQGRGHGAALIREAERVARDLGLAALHITVRGGLGLEGFYESCGYKEVGRLPGALRLGPGDDRDDVHMWLALT